MAGEFINIVWLDQAYENILPKSRVSTHLSFCKIDPYLVTFRETNQCIDYITDLSENDKNVLVISFIIDATNILIQLCEELLQITSIYILHNSNEEISMHFKTSIKVHGCFSDQQLLLNQLNQIPGIRRQRRKEFTRDDFLFSTLATSIPLSPPFTIACGSNNSSSNNSHPQGPEFMYSLFLRDILLNIDTTKQEMIDFCRQKYAGSKADLNVIDEFQDYYNACNAIFWYTRDTFLFRLLNEALRTQHIDTLYSLRYFIKDLHQQLIERHSEQILGSNFKGQSVRTVYRGQVMETWEFERKVLNNVGGFFSVSSFFSTTVHENLARIYAGDDDGEKDSYWEQHVLFKIDIDTIMNRFPFADITTESVFQEDENEVLFTIGATFRIHSVSQEYQGTWIVQLNMVDEEDRKLKELSQHMLEDAHDYIPLTKLAKLLSNLARYDKAEKYYLLSLQFPEITDNLPNLVKVYNELGSTYRNQGKLEKAVGECEKALKICLNSLPSVDPLLIDTYNNLGSIYAQQQDYVQALSYCIKALETAMKDPKSNEKQIAMIHENLGMIYSAQHNYSEALDSYEQCLRITVRILPSNHPFLAIIYANIASIYQAQNEYIIAETLLKDALHIQLTALPVNHPTIVTTYMNLGQTLYDQGRVKEALVYVHKAMDTLQYSKKRHHSIGRFAIDRNESTRVTKSQKDEDDVRLFNIIMKNLKANITGMVHENDGYLNINLGKGFRFYFHLGGMGLDGD